MVQDADKFQAEAPAVVNDRVHRFTVEYTGFNFEEDAHYYLMESVEGTDLLLAHFARISGEAVVNCGGSMSTPPHKVLLDAKAIPGWTLAAYAIRKSLSARFRFPDFDWEKWQKRASVPTLPEDIRRAILVTTDDDFKPETRMTQKPEPVMAEVRRVFRRLDFEQATVTRLGIYLSTTLTMREVSAAVLDLARDGAITESGRGGSIILSKLEVFRDKWVDPPALEAVGGFRHTRLPYDGKPIVFVMMPFQNEFWNWLDGKDGSEKLRSLISQWSGATCVTVDDDKTDAIIEDKIATHISEALFSVANISDLNPNVFYELGIAHALGKPVILVYDEEVHKKHAGSGADGPLFGSFLKSVFDVNHRRIIRCTSKKDLIPQLEEVVRQVLKTLGR